MAVTRYRMICLVLFKAIKVDDTYCLNVEIHRFYFYFVLPNFK